MITGELVTQDLEAYLYKEIIQNYDEKKALLCTKALFDCLYLNFRGQLMYVPTSDKVEFNHLRALIYREFTGSNYHELAIKYKRSLPNIYNITKTEKAKEIRKRQVDMFPLPEPENTKPLTLMVMEDYLPHELIKCGISDKDAKSFAENLSRFLCKNFPGISIVISDTLRKKRADQSQLSLF
jgi:Mor family transcriptional regulator